MPKKVSRFVQNEEPINWWRAIVSGMIATIFMMAFIDIFYLLGLTPFSFELYLGSLIRGTAVGEHNWVVGFFASIFVGSMFGIFYGYLFEYLFIRASARLGVWIGIWHTAVVALVIFPFFNALHEFSGTHLYPSFGILGSGLGFGTMMLLIVAHLLYGMTVGLFYGDVREGRVYFRDFEPGDTLEPGDPDIITQEDDPIDKAAS